MTRIINLFRHNALQKLIALVAAFVMWVFFMSYQDPPINGNYTVPLTISNTPYEFIPVCDVKTVVIETRAPRSNFVKYDVNAFRVYANVENLGEGTHEITPQVVMPQGFELVETDPATVTVKLDPLIERQFPIELKTTGTVAENSAISEINKSVEVITVVGPKSFVEQVDEVHGTLNLTGNDSSFETQISMNAVDKNKNLVKRVRVVPSVITVSVKLESGLKKRIVPIVPELTAAEGWELTKVTTNPAQIEVVGAEAVINSVFSIKTVPFTVQTGQRVFNGTLELEIPEGVTTTIDKVEVSASVIRKPIMRDQ